MPEKAGFHFEQAGTNTDLLPVVLLHGSGSSESLLLDFARRTAPRRMAFALRGQLPWEDGFAFFRRRADRTLDRQDLQTRCSGFCGFLEQLLNEGHGRPLLIGYSNGAILAAASAVQRPDLSAGAVLLRPLSPCAEGHFPPLPHYPVLLLGGKVDTRRNAEDTPHLARQFRQAGAEVTSHLLPTGHAWGETDEQLSRAWLSGRP